VRQRDVVAVILAAAVLLSGACSKSTHRAQVDRLPGTSVTSQRPPTPVIAWAGGPLHVPFSADRDALVVTPGQPPPGVTRQQAIALMREALLGPPMTGPTSQPVISPKLTNYQALAGSVSLKPGLGSASGLTGAKAWVLPYKLDAILACPSETTADTVPTDASMVYAVVVSGSDLDHVTIYLGAGTTGCIQSTAPQATKATTP
jgi:hypothetical protein